MRHLWPLAAVALLTCTVAVAAPAPSFLGDTGLILTPNALTAGRHTVTPHWHSMSGSVNDRDSENWDSIGALFGLSDRLELYLGYFSFDEGSAATDQFVAHVKAQALREPDDWCNLAVGIRNMGTDDISGSLEPTGYAVATKTVCGSEEEEKYLRLSLGLQFANQDDFFSERYWPQDLESDSLFGSAEWMICRRATLMAEMQEVGGDDTVVHFGARVNVWKDLLVDLLMLDDPGDDEREFAVGASRAWAFDLEPGGSPEDRKTSQHNAWPSFFGDTGMILMPNALTAPRHTVTIVYHDLNADIGTEDSNDIGAVKAAGLLFGATNRLEVYAGSLSYSDDPFSSDLDQQDYLVFNAKAQALREPDDCLNLAVGVREIGLDEPGPSDGEPTAYIAATKTLFDSKDEDDPSFLRATLGLLLANEDGLLSEDWFPEEDEGDYQDCSLFGGVEWMLGKYVTLLGEVIEVGDDEAMFNFGARVHPCDRVTVDLFFVDDVANDDPELAWGATYRIPF